MNFEKKRWISLLAGILLNLLGGVGYAWSVFVFPLNEKFGWSLADLSIAYTLNSVTMLVANILIIPRVRKALSLKKVVIVGGLLYGGGIALSGHMPSILLFYLTYSIIAGIGDALIYPVLISYSQEIFPERSGFASGLMAAGMGFGAVVWASVANWLFLGTGDISMAMTVLGIIFAIGIILSAFFVYEVPEGFREDIMKKNADKSGTAHTGKPAVYLYEKPRKEMLKDPLFYMLYICIISGAVCGTMVITQGSPIMQDTFTMTSQRAALVVSLFSLSNTIGRPLWGCVSDKLGRINSFTLLHLLMGTSMVFLYTCRIQTVFVAALMLATFCFGGIASLVAPITSDFWGAKYISENYGITFSVFGISSLIGAPLIANIFEKTGTFHLAFLAGLGMSLLGLLLSLILKIRVSGIQKTLQNE